MFLSGSFHDLAIEHLHGSDDHLTGGGGDDDIIHHAALGSLVGVIELVLVLLDQLGALLGGGLAEDDIGSTLGSHYGDLGGGPGVNDIGAQILAAHGQVSAAVGLTQDHGDLRNGGFAVGIDDLGAVTDDTAVLLSGTGQEAGNIHQRKQRNTECIAGADKAGSLIGAVDIHAAGHGLGLVGNNTNGAAVEAGEAGNHIGGIHSHVVHVLAAIGDGLDDFVHIIRFIGVIGNDGIQLIGNTIGIITIEDGGSGIEIIGGQIAEQTTDLIDAVGVIGSHEVRHAADAVVGHSAAQFFGIDLFAGNGFDYIGAGDEHLTGLIDLEDEIGEGGGVNSTAGAGAHDGSDLRNNTGSSGIAEEDLAVTFQTVQTFLNTGTAGIVHAYYRRADLTGVFKDLADLIGLHFTHGTTNNGEILSIGVDDTAVYLTVAANNTIPGEVLFFLAKVVAAVDNEGIDLNEGVGIKQGLQALASGHFALLVLLVDTRLAATESD